MDFFFFFTLAVMERIQYFAYSQQKGKEDYRQYNEFAFKFFLPFDILLLILKDICKCILLKSGTSISNPFHKNFAL